MSDYTQANQLTEMTIKQEFVDLRERVDHLRKRAEDETNIRMTEFIKEVDPANKAWTPFVTAVDDLKRVEQIISTLKILDLYESDVTPIEKRTQSKIKNRKKTRKTKTIRRKKPLGFFKDNRTYQTRTVQPSLSSNLVRTIRRTKPTKKRAKPTARARSTNAKRWRAIESSGANKTIPRRRWTEGEVKRLIKASKEADKSLPAGEYYKDVYRRFGPTPRSIAAVRKKAYSLGIYLKEE